MTDFDQALKLKPDDVDALVARAQLRLQGPGLFVQAVGQYDKWIAAHDSDARVPKARNARCWARALRGQELRPQVKAGYCGFP